MLNILSYIKERFFYRSLQREKTNKCSKPAFLEWDSIKTIALINQGGSDVYQWTENQKVYERLKNYGKQVFMFTYCNEKVIPEHIKELHQRIISSKDINWCGIPSAELRQDIINQKFDLLIDLTKVSQKSTLFILKMADVRFRIGKNDEQFQHYFDLLIDWNKDESMHDFMDHIIYYLQIIKQPKK